MSVVRDVYGDSAMKQDCEEMVSVVRDVYGDSAMKQGL